VDKLIINHGERVTEHELGEVPLVIGRDPECDLFFADKKLSRRHARIERSGAAVKLVDLGSRNGSWVNDERIEERQIGPGDEIRLGGLRINLERSPSPSPAVGADDESTVFLKGERSDESSTVLLAGGAPASPSDSSPATMSLPAPTAEELRPRGADPSTVFLEAGAAAPAAPPLDYDDPADETRKKPEPERTVVFEGRPAEPAFDTGKVVIRGQADPSLPDRVAKAAAARVVPTPAPPPAPSAADESLSSPSASVTFVPDEIITGRSLVSRLLIVALSLSLFSLLVLPIPLLRLARAAVDEESSKRARVLVDLLATANETALGEGRFEDVTIERVAGESGVTGAYIVSPAGDILAPRDRAGQKLELSGFTGSVGDVRSFRAAPLDGGETAFARPVTYRGTRVGVAVLSHRAGGDFSGWANVVLAFGSLLLLIAVAVAVLAAARMTLNPLNELRADIESLGDERAIAIPVQRSYRELSSLAVSLNRVFATRAPREAPRVRDESPPRRS
jgi:hypothetical protein